MNDNNNYFNDDYENELFKLLLQKQNIIKQLNLLEEEQNKLLDEKMRLDNKLEEVCKMCCELYSKKKQFIINLPH